MIEEIGKAGGEEVKENNIGIWLTPAVNIHRSPLWHKVKKHWVTIAVTGLALGLSFAGLNYASAEEQSTPVNEATVETIIKEGAIDVEAPATSEATAKPTENTPATASSEAATVSEKPVRP